MVLLHFYESCFKPFINYSKLITENFLNRGAIHTFRLALWSAHFGGFDQHFLNPSSQVSVIFTTLESETNM